MKIDFFHQAQKAKKIKNKIFSATNSILKSGKYTNGPYVKKFEEKFKKLMEAKYCVAVNNGTSALHLALVALGIKRGDEVIVPSISFVASAAAITYVGAKPVFVDVNMDDWLINVNSIAKVITKRTKAIMPVHLHGLMCDMRKIKKISKKFNLKIIEDASQAHGSKYYKTSPGFYSDIATFSFYPTKNLGAIGEGGAVITNNKSISRKITALRAWAENKNSFFDIGYNYRMPELIAASLDAKISYLKNDIKKRILIANFYKKNLKNKNFSTYDSSIKKNSYHLFAVRLKNRDKFRIELKKKGIDTAIHYKYCLPNLKIFSNYMKNRFNFKVGTKLSKELVSLPIYPELTKKQQLYIIKISNDYFSNNN